MKEKKKLKSGLVAAFLIFIIIWNLISFVGADYPFFTGYYPGKWLILRKLWFVFLPSNVIFFFGTLALTFSLFYLSKKPKIFKTYASLGLTLATATALLNCLVVLVTINSFTPSWIRAILNFLGLIVVLFY